MNDAYSIYSKITLDLSEYKKSIAELQKTTNKIEGSLTDMSKNVDTSFKQIAKTIGVAFAVKEVVRFGKYAVKSAEEAESQFRKLAQTVKVTGAETWTTTQYLVKMSEQLSNQTNYSVTEIQEMQTVLLGFKNITGEAFDETSRAILDMAEVMGMDLKSATQAVGKALDDPIKGMGALSRQGFVFSEQEKENLKLLMETGNQLEAQKIILNELNTTYGNASREGQNAFAQLRNATQNLTEDLGKLLLPTLEKIAKKFADIFTKYHTLLNEGADYEAKNQTRKDVLSGANRNPTAVKETKEYQKNISESAYEDYINTLKWYNLIQINYKKLTKEQKNSIREFTNLYIEEVHHYEAMGLEYVEAIKAVNEDKKAEWEKSLEDVKFIENLETEIRVEAERNRQTALNEQRQQEISDLQKTFDEKLAKSEEEARLMWQTGQLEDELAVKQKILNDAKNAYVQMIVDSNGAMTEDAERLAKINTLIEQCIKLQKDLEKQTDKEQKTLKKNTKKMSETWGDFSKAIVSYNNDIVDEAMNWEGMFKNQLEILRKGFGDAFSAMGQAMVEGEDGWRNWGAVALESLSEVLSALGAQLSAWAVSKAMAQSWGEAALATAASAAAFTASGALKGVANQMKTISDSNSAELKTLKQLKEALDNINKSMTNFSTYVSGQKEYNNILKEQSKELDKARQADEAVAQQREESYRLWKQYEKEYEKVRFTNIKDDDDFRAYKNTLKGFMYAYKATYEELEGYNKNYKQALENYNYALAEYQESANKTQKKIKKENNNLITDIELSLDIIKRASSSVADVFVLKETVRNAFLELNKSAVESLASVGLTFAESFYEGLENGLSTTDVLQSIKKTLKSQMLKLSVYTQEVTDQLTWFSRKIMEGVTTKNSSLIEGTKKQLKTLYDQLKTQATEIETFFNDIFGNIEEGLEDIVGTAKDMAGDIADELSSALEEGLEQGDFMDTMKKYLRKMVIQTVVYTQSLKTEIEAIGKAISEGIANGFTETGLHEIKRDLSYVFEQANSAINKVDSVLNKVFDVSGYATGTQNATAGLHLVGEAGAELVRFKGGEQVYNAQDTQKILSGAGNNFNVTFNNLQDTSAYAMISQLKAYNRQMAIDGIL